MKKLKPIDRLYVTICVAFIVVRVWLAMTMPTDTLMKGRTSFVIAHRLSTIETSDLILVMKEGDIIESGMHEELLVKGGFYAELYNSQFEEIPT